MAINRSLVELLNVIVPGEGFVILQIYELAVVKLFDVLYHNFKFDISPKEKPVMFILDKLEIVIVPMLLLFVAVTLKE